MEPAAASSISLSLRMAKALSLARSGRMREAEAMISGDRTIPEHPVALEALAALVTSQGEYLRALKLWEMLLQRDPNHPEARRMVAAIELWISRPPWMKFFWLGLSTVAALLVAVIFWMLATSPAPNPAPRSRPAPVMSAPAVNPVSPNPQAAPARPAGAASPTVTFPPAQRRSNRERR